MWTKWTSCAKVPCWEHPNHHSYMMQYQPFTTQEQTSEPTHTEVHHRRDLLQGRSIRSQSHDAREGPAVQRPQASPVPHCGPRPGHGGCPRRGLSGLAELSDAGEGCLRAQRR